MFEKAPKYDKKYDKKDNRNMQLTGHENSDSERVKNCVAIKFKLLFKGKTLPRLFLQRSADRGRR